MKRKPDAIWKFLKRRPNKGVFMLKNKSLLIILLLLAFSNACRQSGNETKAVSNPPSNPAASAPPNKDYAVKVKIKTPDEKTVVEVKYDGSDTKLEYGGKV